MNEHQPWEFTCKTCGGHNLTVNRIDVPCANLIAIAQDKIMHKRDAFCMGLDDRAWWR